MRKLWARRCHPSYLSSTVKEQSETVMPRARAHWSSKSLVISKPIHQFRYSHICFESKCLFDHNNMVGMHSKKDEYINN